METNPQTKKPAVDEFDNREIYCRMLGHQLTFKYCRRTGDGSFCPKILDCWHRKLDIIRYMKAHYSYEQIQTLFRAPSSKMSTLIGLIEKSVT